MILSAQSIRRRCTDLYPIIEPALGCVRMEPQIPMISPFVERSVSPTGKSYGLSSCGYDIRVSKFLVDGSMQNHIRMYPGDFVLASSVERIKMPNNLVAFVKDKSSWAREGLAVQNTVLEPGWEGFITLELSYHKPHGYLDIESGEPIGQLMFQLLDQATEQPYGDGKYQNQEDRPVESRRERSAVMQQQQFQNHTPGE